MLAQNYILLKILKQGTFSSFGEKVPPKWLIYGAYGELILNKFASPVNNCKPNNHLIMTEIFLRHHSKGFFKSSHLNHLPATSHKRCCCNQKAF